MPLHGKNIGNALAARQSGTAPELIGNMMQGFDPNTDPYLSRYPPRTDFSINYNADNSILQDLGRSAATTGRNLSALTLGLPGDIQSIVPGSPQFLPTSEQLTEKFGGDVNHPSYLPASILAPGPGELKGLLGMGKALLTKSVEGIGLAQTLFHGTPFKFKKFSKEAIGSGEGAQAFGHGLYFAENPNLAGVYSSSVSKKDFIKRFLDDLPEDAGFEEVMDLVGTGTFTKQQDDLLRELSNNDWLGFDYPSQAINTSLNPKALRNYDASPGLKKAAEDANKGHLYEVEIPDELSVKMLDWDADVDPEMLRKVREALPGIALPKDLTGFRGEHLYDRIEGALGRGRPELASAKLLELDIPGIRYLDASSRPTGAGFGRQPISAALKKRTRNIVLFSPDDITRVKRDGEIVFDQVKLTHFSRTKGIKEIDPSFSGTGIRGAEQKSREQYPEYWVDRSYYGLDVDTGGYRREPALGFIRYDVEVDKASLYDLAADPDGIFKSMSKDIPQNARTIFAEKQLKEKGWLGYFVGDVAAVFEKVPTK